MLLRFVFLVALILLFSVPLYRFLLKRAVRIKNELNSDDRDYETRLNEIDRDKRKLKEVCEQAIAEAKKKQESAEKVSEKLK